MRIRSRVHEQLVGSGILRWKIRIWGSRGGWLGIEKGIERRVLVGLGKGLGVTGHRRGQRRERERGWSYGGVCQGKVSGIGWDCLGGVGGGGACCWRNFHRLSWTVSASVHVSFTVLGVWICFLWASPFLAICSSAPSWLWVYFSAKSHFKTSPPNCSQSYDNKPGSKFYLSLIKSRHIIITTSVSFLFFFFF